MSKRHVFGDFHIHIGRTEAGQAVKITGARNLTFTNTMIEASDNKGMDFIGIIDAASPGVQQEIADLLERGMVEELSEGGLRYERTTILLGCELEVRPNRFGALHLLCYFPHFCDIRHFTQFLSQHMKNTMLSTQRFHGELMELFDCVEQLHGLIIPAHVFTPFKSLYGSCTDQLADVLPPDRIAAVELGLSADTFMADQLTELHRYPFLTNSDAHSLPKIGREYNKLYVNSVSFKGWREALNTEAGANVVANYGLNPRLGKYYRTFCKQCEKHLPGSILVCPNCGSRSIVSGVRDRIAEIASKQTSHKSRPGRPPYIYQIPLEFIPGVGPRVLQKLLGHFGTEMNILHRATEEQLAEVVGETLAHNIVRARNSELPIEDGGGGIYGRIKR